MAQHSRVYIGSLPAGARTWNVALEPSYYEGTAADLVAMLARMDTTGTQYRLFPKTTIDNLLDKGVIRREQS